MGELEEPAAVRPGALRDHLAGCSDCRAELSAFEELKGALESLSGHPLDPPSWLEGTIIEEVSQKAARIATWRKVERQVRRPQVVTGGALVAAGIAGALLFRSRRRRRPGFRGSVRQALAHAL